MASEIDLCNRVLAEIGTRSSISSFDDGSVEATNCGLFYNVTRQRLLRTAPWGFCRRQVTLTQLGDLYPDNTSPYPFLWEYAYPSDCLKVRYILYPPNPANPAVAPAVGVGLQGSVSWAPSRKNRFVLQSSLDTDNNRIRTILSNVPQAICVYNGDEENAGMFDSLFADALEAALAFKLVIPLSGNVGMKNEYKQLAMQAISEARAADGNESITTSDPKVDWIETRGIGSAYGWGPGVRGGDWGSWWGGWDEMNWSM